MTKDRMNVIYNKYVEIVALLIKEFVRKFGEFDSIEYISNLCVRRGLFYSFNNIISVKGIVIQLNDSVHLDRTSPEEEIVNNKCNIKLKANIL